MGKLLKRLLIGGFLFCTWSSLVRGDQANLFEKQKKPLQSFSLKRTEPVSLKSDELLYNQNLGLAIAQGHVEIKQDGNTLYADTVTYNQKHDKVTASGHVRMINEKGDVAEAHYTELSEGMKEGFIESVRIIQTDNSRLVALKGQKKKRMTVLEKVAYSPCQACKIDPTRPLTWHIKADKVILDDVDDLVSYEGAVLRIKDIPVFYLPGLTHPSPAAKQKTGFLMPRFMPHHRVLGIGVGVPYYVSLSESQSLTLNPFFFTHELPLLSTKYRQKFRRGFLDLGGSYIKPNRLKGFKRTAEYDTFVTTGRPRGHFVGKGLVNISEKYRLKGKVNRLRDKTFYRHYPFFGHQSETILKSEGNLEYFDGLTYGALQTHLFQNLSTQSQSRLTPRVLPRTIFSYTSPRGFWGESWNLSGGTLSVYRHQGLSTHRFSGEGGLSLPYVTESGQEFKMKASLVGDVYYRQHQFHSSISSQQAQGVAQSGLLKNQQVARVFPRVSAQWRYPFARQGKSPEETVFLSPVVAVVSTPRNINKPWIPNEDSRVFEFDDRTFLQENRFPGRDRVDSGTRVDYGFEMARGYQRPTSLFLGQSYGFQEQPHLFSEGSGVRRRSSDYVMRFLSSPMKFLTVSSRSRLNRSHLKCQWNETGFLAGPSLFSVSTHYLYYGDKAVTMTHRPYHIWMQGVNSQLTENWFTSFNMTRDLTKSQQLSQQVSLRYQDDCFKTEASVTRQFYQIPGMKPGITMMVRCDFKNLGDVSYKRTLERPPVLSPLGGSGSSEDKESPSIPFK